MLDESYYDGSRLQKYLEIMARFREEEKREATKDMNNELTAVVVVEYVDKGALPQVDEMLVVDESEDVVQITVSEKWQNDVNLDFISDDCSISGNDKDWMKYLVKDYSPPRLVRVINRKWSKEIACCRLGILLVADIVKFVSPTVQRNSKLELCGYVWLLGIVQDTFGVGSYVRMTEFRSFEEFDRDNPLHYVYVKNCEQTSGRRCVMGVKSGTLAAIDEYGCMYTQNRKIVCSDFIAEGFMSDGRFQIYDLFQRNGQFLVDSYWYRHSQMRVVEKELLLGGDGFVSVAELYSHYMLKKEEDFPLIFFPTVGSVREIKLFKAYVENKRQFVFRVVSLINGDRSLHLVFKDEDYRWRAVPCDYIPERYLNMNVLCQRIGLKFQILGTSDKRMMSYREFVGNDHLSVEEIKLKEMK